MEASKLLVCIVFFFFFFFLFFCNFLMVFYFATVNICGFFCFLMRCYGNELN
jgi:hypothetical protein